MDAVDKKKIVERVIDRKCKEKLKQIDERMPSFIILLEEINNYGNRRKGVHKRL